MNTKTKSFWLLLVLTLLTFCTVIQAQPEHEKFPVLTKTTIGASILEIRKAPTAAAVPDLCEGPVYVSNLFTGTTAFQVSSAAVVTITYYYEYCGGPNQPECCINDNCNNAIGWGEDASSTITTPIASWNDCSDQDGTSPPYVMSFCVYPGTTYYFKASVISPAYNCQNTFVTISADCTNPGPPCP